MRALPEHAPGVRATALYWDGMLAISQGRFAEAEPRLRAALAAVREAGEAETEAEVLIALARWATLVASPDAPELGDAAVAAAHASGDRRLLAIGSSSCPGTCERASDWDRAARLATEALALYRAIGDPYGVATALAELGWSDMIRGTASGPRRASTRPSSSGGATATTGGWSSR